MKKLIILISVVVLVIMLSGCKKNNTDKSNNNTVNIKSEKNSTEYIPEILEYGSEIVEYNPLYSCIKDKEKLLMFASNQIYKHRHDGKKFEVSYYKYDKANKRYEKGEVILKDDTIDTASVVKSLYNEKINTIAIHAYLDKDYLITYDLTNNTSDKICISDYVDVYDYVEDRFSLADENEIFWNNKDTVIFFEKKHNVIVTYNINSKEINCFKVSDYLDSSKTKGVHIYSLDVNDGLLDVYMVGAGLGQEIDNCRIDMEKKEIVSENIFYTRWLSFEDDYIIYCEFENNKCYRVNRQTLGDKEEIPCTEGISYEYLRGFDIIDNYLYLATFESIFKIDLKNKVREKIADADKKEISGFDINLHMITENEGFMIGYKKIDEEKEDTIFVWIN